MGLIFDHNTCRLYESWCHSSHGRAMDRFMEKAITGLLHPRHGERVLDIGCGQGNHLLFLNRLGLDITGVDASPYMISRARERLGDRCFLKIGRAEDLPFDDNEFDLVILINTLEFVDDPFHALREAGRVARGKIFIGAMNSLSWHCLSSRLQGCFQTSLFNRVRFYSLWELKSYVKRVFGPMPFAWCCSQLWPSFVKGMGAPMRGRWNLRDCPFGSFLGVAVTLVYSMKTDNLPLKIRLRKTRESMAGGLTLRNRILSSPGSGVGTQEPRNAQNE